MPALDPRLLVASQMVIPCGMVADIGTDHGRLPIYLMEQRLARGVIATELGEGPYQRALKTIRATPWADNITVRQGDGLEVVYPGEVQTVVIMGLGGDLMAYILGRDWLHTASFARLVLQPMTRPGVVRRLLAQKGWLLLEEKVVKTRERFFVLLSYQPGRLPYTLTPLEVEVGPLLMKTNDAVGIEYLRHCQRRFNKLRRALALARHPGDLARGLEYEVLYKELEAIINGTQD